MKLVLAEGNSLAQVVRDLDLTDSALRLWAQQAQADRGEGQPTITFRYDWKERITLDKENGVANIVLHDT